MINIVYYAIKYKINIYENNTIEKIWKLFKFNKLR